MKVKLRRDPKQDLILRQLRTLNEVADSRFRALNPEVLKRSVSLVDIVTELLEHDPETVRGELRWHCPFHHDTNPSFWAHESYRDSGVGRWGCNPCGESGDVFDLLKKLHTYTMPEALRWVRLWQTNQPKGFIRVHVNKKRKSITRSK